MKSRINKTGLILCFFVILSLFFTGCSYQKSYLEQVDYETLKTKMGNHDNFILYVGNKSCSHCKSFEPKFKKIIETYKVKAYKIDTATLTVDEYTAFGELIGIMGTPTTIFIYNGTERSIANRINGDLSEEKIISKLKINGYIKD